ncbi:carbamoyltransferase [Sphaerisporangium rufum]|uniref:Carbamoyltransferase n=1 Tax=Sphaerisporangium rufum TaxID=1381558 RepID=A0A919QXV1_9ACTN|nr:carbamoyltransferase HypF [Sphaerisporangium rufum]GII76084.1 carbamoyltransferase [Sphaerisporangium rufum]
MNGRVRTLVRVDGIVQGVGFRPFVHRLAARLGLSGHVGNDERGVLVEVEGHPAAVAEFLGAVRDRPPPAAVVERVTAREIPATGRPGFVIGPSAGDGRGRALISPDMATCDDCLRELADPGDRRYGHPFVNCTGCGPRFTIVRSSPYDRAATTMAPFAMCAACAAEYRDPADRRHHAQPVCCPACGPRLRLLRTEDGGVADGAGDPGDPLAAAAELLRAGRIVAVKGVGGYHLAVRADLEPAVAELRARKRREHRPFALMAATLAAARELCAADAAEARLLTAAARPIVLLRRRAGAAVAPSVAPGTGRLGVMLPYSPLHHLLAARVAAPLVLTSGNLAGEPIAHRDEAAPAALADAVLLHDRVIHVRADDSVVQVFRGRSLPVRRSRGYVPAPIVLPRPARRPVLGCGAELKHTFCLAGGGRAFVSAHTGDLADAATHRAFTEGVAHFERLFGIVPRVVAHDLHPQYLSTRYALARADAEPVGVQHHHAHIASCLADNGAAGPVIGVAFDGLGYGPDGTLWGGEFLVADLTGFVRAGHLAPVPMPGGAAAVRQPWRMAAAYLGDAAPPDLPVRARNATHWEAVVAMAARGVNAPATSSAGRLFDAVSALVTGRDAITYEGQAAVELEEAADRAERGAYPCPIDGGTPFVARGQDMVAAAAADLSAGVRPGVVAARFHNGLAGLVAAGCALARERTGLAAVALSGGVWQNLLLLERAVPLLEAAGFQVLLHSRVPPNDGGVSLGQAAIAAALDHPSRRRRR